MPAMIVVAMLAMILRRTKKGEEQRDVTMSVTDPQVRC